MPGGSSIQYLAIATGGWLAGAGSFNGSQPARLQPGPGWPGGSLSCAINKSSQYYRTFGLLVIYYKCNDKWLWLKVMKSMYSNGYYNAMKRNEINESEEEISG